MMPEEWKDYQAELEAGGGLTGAQRAAMEADHTALRGGASLDAQRGQLQRAAAMSGAGALSGRDLFAGDVATQEAQARMMGEQDRQIQGAALAGQQQILELQQRQASSDAAKKQAAFNLGADLLGLGAQVGVQHLGGNAMKKAQAEIMEARRSGNMEAAQDAALRAAQMHQSMVGAGAFGDGTDELPPLVADTLTPSPGTTAGMPPFRMPDYSGLTLIR